MNKYCFELYEFGERGRVFLGFKQVRALTKEDALAAVEEKLDENIRAFQIYINPSE